MIVIELLFDRLVKLTSPSLNYFIILGAVLMYASMIFAILPSVKEQVVQARCIVRLPKLLHGR